MTEPRVYVTISIEGRPDELVIADDEGLDLVRLSFNPSGDQTVTSLKAIAACYASLLCQLRNRNGGVVAQEALSMLRTTSMTAVYAATKGK